MMICYDGFFPEVARELTNRGAEVIAWPVWGCNQLLARARACENHVYIISSTYMDVKDDWMISACSTMPARRSQSPAHGTASPSRKSISASAISGETISGTFAPWCRDIAPSPSRRRIPPARQIRKRPRARRRAGIDGH